jgi:hypothetical protein
MNVFVVDTKPQDPAKLEEGWDYFTTFYRKFLDRAAANGVKVALHPIHENAQRHDRDLVHNYATMMRLIERVPRPSNGVCLCIGNFWNSDGDEMYDQIRGLGAGLTLVHVRSTHRDTARRNTGSTIPWAPISPRPSRPCATSTTPRSGARALADPDRPDQRQRGHRLGHRLHQGPAAGHQVRRPGGSAAVARMSKSASGYAPDALFFHGKEAFSGATW